MTVSNNQSNSEIQNKSGSLANSEPEFLAIGRIGKTHGLQGELWMNLITDFPERLENRNTIYIGKHHKEFTILSFRPIQGRGLIKFPEFNNPEEARVLTNQYVFIKTEGIPELPKDEYYHHDLIGVSVIDEEQQKIGTLIEIMQTGANDVYLVRSNSGDKIEILVPAIKSVIIHIDIEEKTMVVRLQEWA